jgi:hypothetical protein
MKKILVLFLFLVAAVASFAQIDSIKYPARKMPFGNWDFIWTNGALTDTVKVYPEKGGIGLDTLFFSDGTKLSSDTGLVKTTGDTITGSYIIPGDDSDFTFYKDATNYIAIDNDEIILNAGASGVFISPELLQLSNSILNINEVLTLASDTTMDDDASIVLTNGISGWGEVYAFTSTGIIDEWAEFIFSSDGTVYLKSNSTDVSNIDEDGKLCIFDNGTSITIRNRLGTGRQVKYIIHH